MKLDEKGAVPIPYIIALVLGVIVIALISYWLFMSGGEFGTAILESSCQAKKMNYCNTYKATGSAPKGVVFSVDTPCPIPVAFHSNFFAPECCKFAWANGGIDLC